jgi:transcription elongation GreA/GreB family factor
MSPDRTAEIEADIERQREHLADTVDALAHKLDMKAQAKERASRLADRATTSEGRPRPDIVAAGATVVVLTGLLVWLRRR